MIKRFLLPLAVAALTAGIASATPITGSFSLLGLSGSYVTGSVATGFQDNGTAGTATGLDFLPIGGTPTAYTFGQAGSAYLANATGSFAQYNGALVSINDILFGANGPANPYTSNPFIVIGGYTFNFANAGISRVTPQGASGPTSIAVAGSGGFGDGNAADYTNGTFNLATSSLDPNTVSFTFTGNVGSSPVAPTPEPSSLALLGTGVLGVAGVLRRRFAKAKA